MKLQTQTSSGCRGGTTFWGPLGIVLGLCFLVANSNAQNRNDRDNRPNRVIVDSRHPVASPSAPQTLTELLVEFATQRAAQGDKMTGATVSISKVVNDEIVQREASYGVVEPLFLEENLNELMDAMIRRDGKYPVVVGPVGGGKSALIESLVKLSDSGKLPHGPHRVELQDRAFFRVSGRNFIPGGLEFKAYLKSIQFIGQSLNIRPVVVVTDTSFLSDYHYSILVELAQDPNAAPVILDADDKSFATSVQSFPNFQRYATAIRIKTRSKEEMLQILTDSGHLQALGNRYSVGFTDAALRAAVEISEDYRLDLADPARTISLLEAAAIQSARKEGGKAIQLDKKDIFAFVAEATGVPVVPQDRERFLDFMAQLRQRVLAKVRGQDHMVNGIIDQFQAALTARGRKHSIAMVMGPTGVGKTYGAEVLAEEFYGNKDRVLKLDMTQFQDEHQINVLFGAPNGYLSSDSNKGTICEFLDGVGRNGGIIIMDEFEEAHAKVVTRMMEMFDQGYIRGGDGKLRYLGRSLIVMTSNKQSDKILPSSRVRGMSEAELDKVIEGISQEQMKKAWTEKSSYTEQEGSQVKTAVMERIDRFYYAKPLLQERAEEITGLEVNKYIKEQALADDITLEVDPSFAATLTGAFYNEENGARQLRTMVQQTLSRAIQEFRRENGSQAQNFSVSAELHPTRKTDSFVTITDKDTGKSLTIEGPRIPVKNKLFDTEFRERIQNLETNLKSEVFGQNEAIQSVVGAAKSRYLKADNKKAVAGFLIGTTGTGKTQLGKSTAKHLFGRADAFGLFEMGNVNDEHDLANILSPPKGIIGSDQPGQLEQFLNQFPDGGVLIFDEMSNAGKNNPALKNSLYKQFYGMLEEGVYKTPSGKVYDLTKYLILFTGNDGEQVFKGLTSDSLIDETYKRITKDPEMVKSLLRESGAPDAFLGRLAFVTLMRPATSKVKALIAEKMLKEWISQVESSQPFDVTYDPQFITEIAELMFSPQSGARSLVQFLDTYMGQLVADSALDYNWEEILESGQRGTIHISLAAEKPSTPFYEGEKPFEAKATLKVEARMNGQKVSERTADVTDTATFMPQVHKEDALHTAIHEMGHLITSFTSITGKHPVKITIIPEKAGSVSALGYAQYRDIPVKGHWNHSKLVHYIAGLLGGSEAESLLGGSATNAGRSNDVESAGQMAQQIILERHLLKDLDTAHAYVDKDGHIVNNLPQKERHAFDNYLRKVMEEARKLAINTIKANAHVVMAGAELLMKHGNLTEDDIQRLLVRGLEAKDKAGYLTQQAVRFGMMSAVQSYPMSLDGIVLTPASESNHCDELLAK